MNILNEPSLDHEAIAILKDATDEMFNEIIMAFLEDTPKRLNLLCQAIDENNIQSLTEESHCIKGSSGNIGALKLSKICEIIEKSSKNDGITNQKEYIQLAINEFDTIEMELTKLL